MWIEYKFGDKTTHPKENKKLWYFFDIVGVHLGMFRGEHCFASKKGFLTGDVTHWQYYEEEQEQPARPAGFKSTKEIWADVK